MQVDCWNVSIISRKQVFHIIRTHFGNPRVAVNEETKNYRYVGGDSKLSGGGDCGRAYLRCSRSAIPLIKMPISPGRLISMNKTTYCDNVSLQDNFIKQRRHREDLSQQGYFRFLWSYPGDIDILPSRQSRLMELPWRISPRRLPLVKVVLAR